MSEGIALKLEREKFWQEHIAGWKQGNLSQESYCSEQQISFSAFCYWRTQFNQRAKRVERLDFVKVQAIGLHKQSQPGIQIALPNGVRIGINQDARAQMVREVLGVVVSC